MAFDLDGNGVISFDELKTVLGNEGDIVNMFCEADANNDGFIDFDEFEQVMLNMTNIK